MIMSSIEFLEDGPAFINPDVTKNVELVNTLYI